MISVELRQAFEAVRSAAKLEREWSMMNSFPEGISRAPGLDAPTEYLDLLTFVDGPILGQVVVYRCKVVESMQVYAEEDEGAPVRLGVEKWFCFGKANEDPLFINRRDGTVWGFPDRGIVWQDSEVFGQFAGSLGEFLETYALGSKYLTLPGVDEDDQWWRLLKHVGRV
ncbi:hypothetical protein [Nocardia sp. NRRL S-836]|uniref:hypothetical protein n=1 Tax=Nocardia sp. NRRL S-836 TaxID=1519492 RepID=UPI000ADD8251|nr:hypothetical protein [Nocardia sp. NRRL S-836]